MSIYRKNENGGISKAAGSVVQRWNDKIFMTEHTVADGKDYYEIEPSASKYILSFKDQTEYQLYITEPNVSDTVYIAFKGQSLELRRSSLSGIVIGSLGGKLHCYTLQVSTGEIWTDAAAEMQQMAIDIAGKANLSGGNSFNGNQSINGELSMEGEKIKNLADGASDNDALAVRQLTGHHRKPVRRPWQ